MFCCKLSFFSKLSHIEGNCYNIDNMCAGLGLKLTRGTTAWCSLLISQNNNCVNAWGFLRTCQQYPDPFLCTVHVFIKLWQFLRAIKVIQSISYHSFIIHNPAVFKSVNQNWPNLLWKFILNYFKVNYHL